MKTDRQTHLYMFSADWEQRDRRRRLARRKRDAEQKAWREARHMCCHCGKPVRSQNYSVLIDKERGLRTHTNQACYDGGMAKLRDYADEL